MVALASDVRNEPLSQVRILGVRLDNVTPQEALDLIFGSLDRGRGGWVLTPNLDILRRLIKDPAYRLMTAAATLRVADGMPLIWASRIQGTPLKARVAGSDLIWGICERAAQEGRSVFFLGGNPGAADDAAMKLQGLYRGLDVAGTECPPLGFERDPGYMRRLIATVRESAPDVCFVALSTPKQDRIIRELMPLLPRTWFLGIGISFSFVSGEVRRAPLWMRKSGLEWVHRLIQEPRRLGRRYLVDGVPFGIRLLGTAAARRLRGTGEVENGAAAGRAGMAQVTEPPILARGDWRRSTAGMKTLE
jgi:N-acetylglucosaminyldiphosphoundecaprenol N-acetyl-beta-D-mannosaminyltransferase